LQNRRDFRIHGKTRAFEPKHRETRLRNGRAVVSGSHFMRCMLCFGGIGSSVLTEHDMHTRVSFLCRCFAQGCPSPHCVILLRDRFVQKSSAAARVGFLSGVGELPNLIQISPRHRARGAAPSGQFQRSENYPAGDPYCITSEVAYQDQDLKPETISTVRICFPAAVSVESRTNQTHDNRSGAKVDPK
jgi:hypothetical protein